VQREGGPESPGRPLLAAWVESQVSRRKSMSIRMSVKSGRQRRRRRGDHSYVFSLSGWRGLVGARGRW
jgi:hypothetical protein